MLARVIELIQTSIGLNAAEAAELHAEYYHRYGTSMVGLSGIMAFSRSSSLITCTMWILPRSETATACVARFTLYLGDQSFSPMDLAATQKEYCSNWNNRTVLCDLRH